ncbi:hypothetical protein ABZ371_09040 [Streptomyces sp. NPDC005899]|uniref:hypothetical protein n=1 Tax=Streptomyces sp. NPDC005899 TaxID=3155716 RepID=UPI0033E052DE
MLVRDRHGERIGERHLRPGVDHLPLDVPDAVHGDGLGDEEGGVSADLPVQAGTLRTIAVEMVLMADGHVYLVAGPREAGGALRSEAHVGEGRTKL